MLTFTVPGQPQGKGRARASMRNGRIHMHTPEKTAAYENRVALFGVQAMAAAGMKPMGGPLRLTVAAVFAVPASWSKAKRAAALAGQGHTSKPDIDNVVKAVADGLNGVAWADDSQVCAIACRKTYGAEPGLTVTVEQAE